MKRLAAGTSALALLGGLFVGVFGASAGAAGSVQPSLAPPPEQTAVKSGDVLTLGGTVTAGYTQAVEAYVRFEKPDGTPGVIAGKQRDPVIVQVSAGGTISGTKTLTNLDQPEGRFALDEGHVFFGLTVRNPQTGAQESGETPTGLLIDLQPPYITGTFLTGSRTLRVDFSEPVAVPAGTGENNIADWDIDNSHHPLSVSGSGAQRTLSLAPIHEKDQDATPRVQYGAAVLVGKPYRDRAGWSLGSLNRGSNACDLIPPVAPVIESVAGVAGKSATANDKTPVVTIGGLRTTGPSGAHYGQVYVESNGEAGFQFGGDSLLGERVANALGKANVTLDDLGPDGTYTLYGVARDQATCSFPRDSQEPPNHSTADQGTYVLDTFAPRVVYALYDASTITVQLTESIKGTDDPSDWAHPSGIVGVENPNDPEPSDQRILFPGPVPVVDGSILTYNGAVGDYTDVAGNKLETFNVSVVDVIPPIVTITTPDVPTVYTNQPAATIAGTVQASDKVRLYRGGAPTYERERVVSGDTYEFSGVSLSANQANDFQVTGFKVFPPQEGEPAGPVRIVHDDRPPTVSIQAPQARDIVRGGDTITIRWTADDNPDNLKPSAAIALQYTLDGGATPWRPFDLVDDTGQYQWQVPEADTVNARIAVIATDLAGNSTRAETPDFEIDSTSPQFIATTTGPNDVEVSFLEGVLGTTGQDEWEIAGNTVGSLTDAKNDRGEVVAMALETLPVNTIGKNDTPLITYEPKDLPIRQEFADAAGNPLANMTVVAIDGIVPVPPTVTQPTAPQTTGADTYEIEGTAEAGTLVTAYRDDNGDGTGDTVAGSRQLGSSQTRYKITAALADGQNKLLVAASDGAGNVSDPPVPVPVITKDAGAPVIDVLEPDEGALYAAASNLTVRWTAVDANFVENPITIRFSTDGGETYETLAEGEANDGEFTFTLPDQGVEEARVQVSAIDELGLEASGDSGLFRILVCDIVGTNGDDVITGTPASEVICSLDGTDTVDGLGGDDFILSGDGDKTVDGGEGDDIVEGGPGNDSLDGGAGNDIVHGRRGNDVVQGGDGDDAVFGDLGNDRVAGGAGDDRLNGFDGDDVLEGGGGKDLLVGGAGNDRLSGGEGDDRLQGDDGNDVLAGGGGKDLLVGGAGNDRLSGGEGDDRLQGDDGNDVLAGDQGGDTLVGNGGDDTVLGGDQNDLLIGGDGDDRLVGGDGADTARGGAGEDILNGGQGRDTLRGGAEADVLRGARGPDALFAQAGDDRLRGGPGKDLLNGGGGADNCRGGPGRTTYKRC